MPKSSKVGEQEVQMDRRFKERRTEDDLSAGDGSEPVKAVASEEKQPRRKKQRRRQIDPTTCERDYNEDEIKFMQAMDDYKRSSGRMFPTCSEILEVVRDLGYTKLSTEERDLLSSIADVEQELADAVETSGDSSTDEEEALEAELFSR